MRRSVLAPEESRAPGPRHGLPLGSRPHGRAVASLFTDAALVEVRGNHAPEPEGESSRSAEGIRTAPGGASARPHRFAADPA